MSAANRARGARAEVAVVNYLRSRGWADARRYLSGDGRQPGDIDVWPGIAIEVKDRARSSWPSWCAQAVAEAGGRIPVVVRRTRGNPDVGQWECRLPIEDWMFRLGGDGLAVRSLWAGDRFWAALTFAELCDLIRDEVTA